MTKIFKISLALCVLWFAVPYFYHSYLDNKVFRKIEKEYCEKDAGLMVFVDKIDFSQPVVVIVEGEDEVGATIVNEYPEELRNDNQLSLKGLNKKEIYLDLRKPYYLWKTAESSYFNENRQMNKYIFSINKKPVLSGIYKQIISQNCFDWDKNRLPCLPNDFTLKLSTIPTQGIFIKKIYLKQKVIFTDYVIKEDSFFGQDIATKKKLFSFKGYTYFGEIGYAKTYNPNEVDIFGSSLIPPNVHHCTGDTNPAAINKAGNSHTTSNFKYLKEHYDY